MKRIAEALEGLDVDRAQGLEENEQERASDEAGGNKHIHCLSFISV